MVTEAPSELVLVVDVLPFVREIGGHPEYMTITD